MRADLRKQELYKVVREIKTHGESYTFERSKLDDYNEPTEEKETVATVNGLYHVTKGYVSKTVGDATTTHSKGQPMILAVYEETENIKEQDRVTVEGKPYKVVGRTNVGEYSILNDISLEEVYDGSTV